MMAGVLLSKLVFQQNTAHSKVCLLDDVAFMQYRKMEKSINLPRVHIVTTFLPI